MTDEKQKTSVSYLCLKAKPENQTAIEDCIAQSFRELEVSMAGTERMVQIFTLRLLNQYPAEAASDLYVCRKKQRGSLKFQSLSAFIHDNIATVSLERLTEEFHYQADYYNRIILKNTGVTYSEYVRRVRMEKAKCLLVSTNLPVQKILPMLGYQCHSYFYGVFRKETGMSPLEYRSAHKGSIKS